MPADAVALGVGVLVLVFLALQSPSSCPDAPSCRTEAEAAAARGDYEAFHDLAWRTVQKGKPNDPASMLLLARAQSLSGRPEDAIVMLGRLADVHAAIDVSIPDFDRARQRPGWDAVAARFSSDPPPPSVPSGNAALPSPAVRLPVVKSTNGAPPSLPGVAVSRSARSSVPSGPASAKPPASSAGAAAAPRLESGEPLTFEPPPALGAIAIAHDAVSRRFVIGDAPSRRLLVVDEVSTHVVPYVSAASAGFYDELTAFALDARRGDLWVASSQGSGSDTTSIVHKLQLVSGRGLMEVRPEASLQPLRLIGVAVAPDGTVFALDAAGGRLLRLRPGTHAFEVVVRIDEPNPTAIAAADDRVVFVASAAGLLRADVGSRTVQPVKSVEDLGGFSSIAWHDGALVGVQRASGASLAVRVALDGAGTRAQPRAILAASPQPIVGTLADGTFYYLVGGAIHRVAVR
jgi:hypothetical protein